MQLKKSQPSTLGDALRAQGLRSMAQFLEQVGLDRALNDSSKYRDNKLEVSFNSFYLNNKTIR